MDFEEFEAVLECDDRAAVRELFDVLDRDGSGELDESEFVAFLQARPPRDLPPISRDPP